jgi:hypothetical protein
MDAKTFCASGRFVDDATIRARAATSVKWSGRLTVFGLLLYIGTLIVAIPYITFGNDYWHGSFLHSLWWAALYLFGFFSPIFIPGLIDRRFRAWLTRDMHWDDMGRFREMTEEMQETARLVGIFGADYYNKMKAQEAADAERLRLDEKARHDRFERGVRLVDDDLLAFVNEVRNRDGRPPITSADGGKTEVPNQDWFDGARLRLATPISAAAISKR